MRRKFLAAADIHLRRKLYNLPELEQDQRDVFVRICDTAIARKVDDLILVGDVYNDNQPPPDEVRFVRNEVKRCRDHGVGVYGIAGDHDKPDHNGSTWCQISDIEPISNIDEYFGFDYFNYATENNALLNRMQAHDKKELVRWIFLHGQVPVLFSYTEDKKRLDFSNIEIFDIFPNLEGIILGDIHKPLEGSLKDKGKSAYIGYCGSAGIIDAGDISHDKGLLYFDGVKLDRIPFPPERAFVKIDFTGHNAEIFEASYYVKKYKDEEKRPVFIVTYDSENESKLAKIKPLYDVGHVKPSRKKKKGDGFEEEAVNIRSELTTNERTEAVLKKCLPDVELRNFTSDLLKSTDPKALLDQLKKDSL